MSDMNPRFDRLEQKIDNINNKLDDYNGRIVKVEANLGFIKSGFSVILSIVAANLAYLIKVFFDR